MKDRMRKALGFLGLIEDEYGEYTPTSTSRPASESPAYDDDVEWTRPAPQSSRPFPTAQSATPNAPLRVSSNTVTSRPTPTPLSALDSNGQSPRLRAMPSGVRSVSPFSQDRDVVTILPKDYNESGMVTEALRSNRAVVLIVNHLDPDAARRVVDFVAGTSWALKATVEIMEKGAVYLISPQGTHVSPDAKERLRATNYQSTGS
jgi:FtsZ-interacting cell division protein YlmF